MTMRLTMMSTIVPNNRRRERQQFTGMTSYGLKQAASVVEEQLSNTLDHGPMRFGPVPLYDLPVQEQLEPTSENVQLFAELCAEWELSSHSHKKKFTNEQILRVLIFCKYDHGRAMSLLKRMKQRHFDLTASVLKEQLESKTLFPIPELRTLNGSRVFYMRPSRFDPRETSTSTIIDNLVYVMNTYACTMSSSPTNTTNSNGIAFIANMNGWTMDNFSTNYCLQFMKTLQGRTFPAKVDLFLIVDPPAWFGKVWSIMKGMLSTTFQKKVFMIAQDELGFYLKQGYEQYLPDEFIEGRCSTDGLVNDFVTYRLAMEGEMGRYGYGPMAGQSNKIVRRASLSRGATTRIITRSSDNAAKGTRWSSWFSVRGAKSKKGTKDVLTTTEHSDTDSNLSQI